MMALKRTRLPLTARVLVAFTQEETQRFVRALVWAEQPPAVGNGGSTDEGSESREVAPYRDVLVPFANWLSVQTRGQPLYLVETLKELLAREILVPSLGENGAWGLVLRTGLLAETPVGELIPSSVRELIRSQLARLTPSAWALLVAGAALGQGLSFERLIGVAQLDEHEGLRALEELLRHGLLWEGTPGVRWLRLSSRDDARGGLSGGGGGPPAARTATCVARHARGDRGRPERGVPSSSACFRGQIRVCRDQERAWKASCSPSGPWR